MGKNHLGILLPDQEIAQLEKWQNEYAGRFGNFGGRYVAETLMQPLQELENACATYLNNEDFLTEFYQDLTDYVGRPTPLYFAKQLTEHAGGAAIYLKREDLNHTGAHKINNTIGQALLAKRMGKTRLIAETGAGQHGVASATVAARLSLQCIVYMGAEDIRRQALNVYRMKLLGAEVRPVTAGAGTLKDAVNEAMRDWVSHVDNTFYILGSAVGPHPYPLMVRHFQSIIGIEAKQQLLNKIGRLPNMIIACVGGGSNAIGLFYPFIKDENVQIVGVEAGGHGLETGKHAAPLSCGHPGILHGAKTYVLADSAGQIIEPHSISAGLDYPGKGPEHAYLLKSGRANYVAITDKEALQAFHLLIKLEGIMPALESSHAIAYAVQQASKMSKDDAIIVNLSGRGDKDIHTVAEADGIQF